MSLKLIKQTNYLINHKKLINQLIIRTSKTLPTTNVLLGTYVKQIGQGQRYKSVIENFQKRAMSSKESDSADPGTTINEDIFHGKIDRFKGITVESKLQYDRCKNFPEMLCKSLEHWVKTKRRCIWFRVETAHADWICELTKAGFEFHHARHGVVVLYRWLPTNEKANIPEYAHTMIGVGGVVINDKNEILAISEKYAMIPDSWKLPGGYVDSNENFIDAVKREIMEETGIECEYETIISIRHSHRANLDCSDMYIVMGLRPCNLEYRIDEREIAKIKWMPVEEYLNHPNVHGINRFFVKKYLSMLKKGTRVAHTATIHAILKREVQLYHLKHSDTDDDGEEYLVPATKL